MGFLISKEYPGRFLRGEEVGEHVLNLKIKEIKKEKIYSQKEKKEVPNLIIYFDGKERGVVMGKQRAMDLVELFGDDTDKWINKKVEMFTEQKDIFGKKVRIIRFRECSEPKDAKAKKKLSKELDSIAQND